MKSGEGAFLVFLIGILLSGCAIIDSTDDDVDLLIYMSGFFEDDAVQFLLNDEVIFEDTLTTSWTEDSDFSWWPVAIVEHKAAIEKKDLYVVLNDEIIGVYAFNPYSRRVIWVTYEQENGMVRFESYKKRIVFEG